jgi:hypothetical protein
MNRLDYLQIPANLHQLLRIFAPTSYRGMNRSVHCRAAAASLAKTMIRKFMRCVAAALCCVPVVAIAASDDPKELERLFAKVRSEPMVFIVVTGEPNACGRGCSEWIAGQGQFDESAAQRFREFLAVLAKPDLPIFFNSDGGLLSQAVQIGLILRENRMTAGVARTVPEGCHLSSPLGDACRRLMQSKREHKARLYFGGAHCGSACIYAMVGASTRHVDPGAKLRINSSVGPEINKTDNFLRRYVIGMGVDPALVDAAAKIPSRSFRELSRGEMERFGIETRGVHETPWFAYHGPAGEFLLLKSVTYPTGDTGDQYRTRIVGLSECRKTRAAPIASERAGCTKSPTFYRCR